MHSKLLNKNLGFYDSSFFRMHISTNEKIERIDTLSDEAYAILVHEYIHFIQDITTIHGLNNIFSTIQYIKFAVNEIYKGSNEFIVPIEPTDMNVDDFVYFNNRICEISYGDSESYSDVEIIDYKKITLPVDKQCAVKEMPVIEMDIRIDDSYDDKYVFGACCIYESMAYILEKNLSQFGFVEAPDLPYNSAIKMAEKIYKEFAEDEMNVLAVCDISLNCSNPGKVFVEIIEEWKNNNIIPNDPKELYDDFYKKKFQSTKASKDGVIHVQVDYLTFFQENLKLVGQELNSYFRPTNNNVNDEFSRKMSLIRRWISEIFTTVLKWRKENKYFIIDIAEGGEKYNNKYFASFFNEIGMPFCTNNNNDGCFYHPKFPDNELQLSYFSAVSQIKNIFNGSLEVCDLYCYCRKCEMDGTGDVKTDKRCLTPWERSSDKKLCPVSTIWRHWKLDGYKPILKIIKKPAPNKRS